LTKVFPVPLLFTLRAAGIEAQHVGELGLCSAADAEILELARRERRIVVTLDADFHALLGLSGDKERRASFAFASKVCGPKTMQGC
jgi:predicted nuclease of predicted toxin-antitoxin system